jgi:hypothetical protein
MCPLLTRNQMSEHHRHGDQNRRYDAMHHTKSRGPYTKTVGGER